MIYASCFTEHVVDLMSRTLCRCNAVVSFFECAQQHIRLSEYVYDQGSHFVYPTHNFEHGRCGMFDARLGSLECSFMSACLACSKFLHTRTLGACEHPGHWKSINTAKGKADATLLSLSYDRLQSEEATVVSLQTVLSAVNS